MAVDKSERFELCRSELNRLAYRMTGSWAEAEDIVQEAWLRFSKVEVESHRPFLYRITTRLCIDHLKSARKRRETYMGSWLPEPAVDFDTQETVERAESLTLALLFTLEKLSPLERAAFLLRQVYDFEYSELAELLGRSEQACRKLNSRARLRVKEGRPNVGEVPKTRFEPVNQLVAAIQDGDINKVVDCLTREAVLTSDGGGKALAAINPIYGADKIARFFLGISKKQSAEMRFKAAWVGGLPGLVFFEQGHCRSAMAFETIDSKINGIWVVRNPDKLGRILDPDLEHTE